MDILLADQRLLADDLAVEIDDEYNPMIPNSYEKVIRERREEHEKIREEEVISERIILLTLTTHALAPYPGCIILHTAYPTTHAFAPYPGCIILHTAYPNHPCFCTIPWVHNPTYCLPYHPCFCTVPTLPPMLLHHIYC